MKLHFRRMARNMHSKVVAEIYLDCGEMLKNQIPILKPVVSKYKKNLQKAGSEFATTGEISQQLSDKLAKPLLPASLFIREANKYWDRELAKLNN